MKKLLLSFVLLAFCSLTLLAARSSQSGSKNVSVTNTEVYLTDNNIVTVAFRLEVGGEVTARNRSLVIRPVLRGVGGNRELPPIVIRGSRAKAAAEQQAMTALGLDASGSYVTSNGNTVDYVSSVPWQDWMRGSELVFNGLNTGSGKATEVNIGMVADNLLTGPALTAPATQPAVQPQAPIVAQQQPVQQVEQHPLPQQQPVQQQVVQQPLPAPLIQQQPSSVWQSRQNVQPAAYYEPRDQGEVVQRAIASRAPRDYSPVKGYYDIPERQHQIGTIGDELAARFAFLEPVSKFNRARDASSSDVVFDYNMPLVFGTPTAPEDSDVSRFVEMTRQGAVYIKFERGSSVMDRDLGENNTMYVDLISTLRTLDGNPDTRISQVVVVGFSAPEGVLDEKETLAADRAAEARNFITANAPRLNPDVISTYNGSVDWVSLRALVAESNMPEKYKVLEIIDNAPAWNTSRKQSRLGRLMALNDGEVFSYMRRNFFPQLRQTGAYVKVYYENLR